MTIPSTLGPPDRTGRRRVICPFVVGSFHTVSRDRGTGEPTADRLEVLDTESIEYVVGDKTSASGGDTVVEFPLPAYDDIRADNVEVILDDDYPI